MLVQFVAQTPEQVRVFLLTEAGVMHAPSIVQAYPVRRWHDEVWEDVNERSDLGEVWPVFSAALPDNCQDHITNFEDLQRLEENCLYVLDRAFCAMCQPTNECEYIIA